MRQALDEFEKANPDIKVTMQRVTWAREARSNQYLREAAVGTGTDVTPTRLCPGPDHSEPPGLLPPAR